jgi:signal transduction histidine kinase
LLDGPVASDLLLFRAMPEVADALRARQELIMSRWQEAVRRHLPDADGLTIEQVRDSIPIVLEHLARALASAEPQTTFALLEATKLHGSDRFHQSYNVAELITEYRLLRQVLIDEVKSELGPKLVVPYVVAVDLGIDLAMQQGIIAFVQHQAQQLRAAADAEAKYLSFLSHDLRNHLNNLMLSLQALSQDMRDCPQLAPQFGEINSLQRSIWETIDGMERLLQAERLRKKAVQPKSECVDLHELGTEILANFSHHAANKGLVLTASIPAHAFVISDREMLGLVLNNLIANAIKFSDKGTVRLTATPPKDDERGWLLAVSDEGPGIASEDLQRVFVPFTRGETHGQPGVGLGLAIAGQAAELLNAKLTVQSQVGHGSIFELELPKEAAPQNRSS